MVYEVCVVQVDKDDQPTKVLVQPTVVLVKDEHAATVAGARMVEGEPAANSIKVLVRAFRERAVRVMARYCPTAGMPGTTGTDSTSPSPTVGTLKQCRWTWNYTAPPAWRYDTC